MLDQLVIPPFLRRVETPRERAHRTFVAPRAERRIKNPPSDEVLALRGALRAARVHLLAGRPEKARAVIDAALSGRTT